MDNTKTMAEVLEATTRVDEVLENFCGNLEGIPLYLADAYSVNDGILDAEDGRIIGEAIARVLHRHK